MKVILYLLREKMTGTDLVRQESQKSRKDHPDMKALL